MTADLTGDISIGMPVRIRVGDVYYYGIITSIAAALLKYSGRGLAVGAEIQELYFGRPEMAKTVTLHISGAYGNDVQPLLYFTDEGRKHNWRNTDAYIVGFEAFQVTNDTGVEPKINISAVTAGVPRLISNNDTDDGIQPLFFVPPIENPPTAIDATNYKILHNDAIEIACTVAGGVGDAADLSVGIDIVLP